MAFLPASPLLLTTDEMKNFSFVITYEADVVVPPEGGGEPPPAVIPVVTVQAVKALPTVSILNNTISGYYKDSFDFTVNYIDSQTNDYTVTRFSDIDPLKLHELYKYSPNQNTSVTYEYIATARDSVTNAVIATQTYNIVVTQNWTTNKNLLKRYVDFNDYFATYVIALVTADGVPVQLLNNLGNQVFLERT
jgi:hypothetical protein